MPLYKPIKELGQNFLTDLNVVYRMVNRLDLSPRDEIVEIGPGLGALTLELVRQAQGLDVLIFAVEIDKRFVGKLQDMFELEDNVEVVEGNIIDWLPTFHPKKPYKIMGSLPYYITSPILHTIIEADPQPVVCTLLVQKEVAERVCNQPPDASYLSTLVQTFYSAEYLETVSKTVFDPEPSVDGAVIKLKKLSKPLISYESATAQNRTNCQTENPPHTGSTAAPGDTGNTPYPIISRYQGFLHKGFSNPRKMLNKIFSKEELQLIGFNGNLRAQNISPEEWSHAFNTL